MNYLTNFCIELSQPLYFLVQGRHLSHGSFGLLFPGRKEIDYFSYVSCFLVLLAQNNHYVKVAYFGVLYSTTL